ncbi:hypothetical protein BaRGS_00036258, partial [Batillaria attramentaria]
MRNAFLHSYLQDLDTPDIPDPVRPMPGQAPAMPGAVTSGLQPGTQAGVAHPGMHMPATGAANPGAAAPVAASEDSAATGAAGAAASGTAQAVPGAATTGGDPVTAPQALQPASAQGGQGALASQQAAPLPGGQPVNSPAGQPAASPGGQAVSVPVGTTSIGTTSPTTTSGGGSLLLYVIPRGNGSSPLILVAPKGAELSSLWGSVLPSLGTGNLAVNAPAGPPSTGVVAPAGNLNMAPSTEMTQASSATQPPVPSAAREVTTGHTPVIGLTTASPNPAVPAAAVSTNAGTPGVAVAQVTGSPNAINVQGGTSTTKQHPKDWQQHFDFFFDLYYRLNGTSPSPAPV